MANPPVSPKKKKWVGKRDVVLRGTRLTYNASQQDKYKKSLSTLIKQMIAEVKVRVTELFESPKSEKFFTQQKEAAAMDASLSDSAAALMKELLKKFENLFSDKAFGLADTMVKGAKKTSQTTLKSSLKKLSGGLSLNTGVVPKGMEDVSKAIISENVSLIKSIPQEYLNDVTGAVMRSITTGAGIKDLIPQIKKYDGQTDRRAKNLALDQTRKAYNSINKQRMQSIGVKKFEWLHSGGGQTPRPDHIAMSGNIYSFDNLPVIDERTGERGIPGQAINCRCTMTPVIEFEDGTVA